MNHNLFDLMAIARPIAWGAADILLRYYDSQEDLQIRDKGANEGDVTIADLAANQFILTQLQSQLGTQSFAYLTEESEDNRDRLNHDWVWMIDPLDGTSDFIRRTGEFAIHIGLAYKQRPVLGLVAIPVIGKLFTAIQGQGTYLEKADHSQLRQKMQVSNKTELTNLVAIASRSHRSPELEYILQKLPKKEELIVGSIGGKLTAIAETRADFYLSLSGKSAPKDWDYCAPEIILTEAGGQITHFDSSPLTYNNPDISQWGNILATNSQCHQQLCERATKALADFGFSKSKN
jgi:3'(2'), 5'-bisphosphate nucleotidase